MKRLAVIILTLLSFSSCEHSYNYQYNVENQTDSPIGITFSRQYVTDYSEDTLIRIAPHSQGLILQVSHGMEGSHGPYESDIKRDFHYITVTKDSMPASINYLSNTVWSFSKNGGTGIYHTIVTDQSFK